MNFRERKVQLERKTVAVRLDKWYEPACIGILKQQTKESESDCEVSCVYCAGGAKKCNKNAEQQSAAMMTAAVAMVMMTMKKKEQQ
jgi:hypothetical protein